LIIHARWSEVNFTSFELADISTGATHEIIDLPFGRYVSPTICECKSSGRRIAFVRTGGDLLTGGNVATAHQGLWLGDIQLPPPGSGNTTIRIKNLKFIQFDALEVINEDAKPPLMRFFDGANKLLIQQTKSVFFIDFTSSHNDRSTHHELAKGRMSTEIAAIPNQDGLSSVAFIDFDHIFFAPGQHVKKDEPVWSKPGNSTKGLARLSLDGGHDIVFSRDGKKLFWLLGE
jgi:hypothetical protein